MTDHKTARELLVSAIRPALKALGKDDRAHEELLLGSALQESEGLATRVQGRGGPALSYFQMEPFTHDDIWKTYLEYHPALKESVTKLMSDPKADKIHELQYNDKYAAAMACIKYLRCDEPIPKAGDIKAQAEYWKDHYNSPDGAGKPSQYIEHWKRFKGDDAFQAPPVAQTDRPTNKPEDPKPKHPDISIEDPDDPLGDKKKQRHARGERPQ